MLDVTLEYALEMNGCSCVDPLPGGRLIDLECAADVVLLGDDAAKLQCLPD